VKGALIPIVAPDQGFPSGLVRLDRNPVSGGNIQKLILARELSGRPRVLLVAQPTRGIDVGAADYIHRRLIEQRERGTAILIVSEDLDEIGSLCDRILVMYEGSIVGEVDAKTTRARRWD
jgi:simple sugar transport system ATP-binding protein